MDNDKLTFYRSKGLRRQWRWRYQAAGNGAKLANGGESYTKLEDALKAAARVVCIDTTPLRIRHMGENPAPQQVGRPGGEQLDVFFRW